MKNIYDEVGILVRNQLFPHPLFSFFLRPHVFKSKDRIIEFVEKINAIKGA